MREPVCEGGHNSKIQIQEFQSPENTRKRDANCVETDKDAAPAKSYYVSE